MIGLNLHIICMNHKSLVLYIFSYISVWMHYAIFEKHHFCKGEIRLVSWEIPQPNNCIADLVWMLSVFIVSAPPPYLIYFYLYTYFGWCCMVFSLIAECFIKKIKIKMVYMVKNMRSLNAYKQSTCNPCKAKLW